MAEIALLAVGTLFSAAGAISQSNAAQREANTTKAALALQQERDARDAQRDRAAAAGKRVTSLAAQGGLDAGGGYELINEILLEGALGQERQANDTVFQQGVLSQRASNARTTGYLKAAGSIFQGGFGIAKAGGSGGGTPTGQTGPSSFGLG